MATSTRARKKFSINHADADIAAEGDTSLTRTMTAEELGVGLGVFVVKGAQLVVTESGAGGSLSALTVSAGRSGATTAWLNGADMVQGSVPTVLNGSAINLGYNVTDVTAEACRLTFTSTGANLDALTAGEAELLLDIEQLGEVA
jgi:hypothetical protein